MRRVLLALVLLLVAGIVLPPLWYSVFAEEPPALEEAARLVALPDGTRVNVRIRGTGSPVFLIHGLPGQGGDWRHTQEALAARGHQVFAYDRVGYGHSDPRIGGDALHTPDENAQDLLDLMSALGIERARIVGWSYGGVVSIIAAREAPQRIDGMILVGSGGPDSDDARPPEPPAVMRFLYSDPVLAWRSRVPPIARGLMQVSSQAGFSDGPMPEWWMPQLRANFARPSTVLTYRGEMFAIPSDPDADLGLDRITVPTLVLHGDDDRLAPIAIGRYLASAIPDATLREFPGGSHMLPITHADALAEAISTYAR